MIRTITIILSISFFISCTTPSNDHETKNATQIDFKDLDTTINFSGSWLSENYNKSIREFKSPRKSQEDGCEFIVIPEKTLQKTMMIYNFHEGMGMMILKNKEAYEAWEFEDDSLIRKISSIEILSPEKIKFDTVVFDKISSSIKPDNQILEEILFKGKYTNAGGKIIEFKSNGEITGLDNFHFYQPLLDYFDAGLQIDQIGLGSSKKDPEYFGFKFKKDTLELYNIKCLTFDNAENRCVDVTFGQLKYKMWKTK